MARHGEPDPARAVAALAGYTVAVASDRRRHRLAELLESVGARTVGVQAARSVARPDQVALRAATRQCLAGSCDDLVVSSAVGLRAWIRAAQRWGLGPELVARLAPARLLARDAAAADALRALGLRDVYSTPNETTEELLRYLAAQPLAGRRVVVQTSQLALSETCAVLRAAEVVEVPTYTAAPPAETYSVRRLCDLVLRRHVDALVLVGAAAAAELCAQATRDGLMRSLASTLGYDIPCVALGPRTAQPIREHGVPVLLAERPYAEELAEEMLAALPRRGLRVAAGGHDLEVRGQAVIVDGRLIAVPGGPLAVLRALARRPGQVLSAAEIRGSEPAWAEAVDDHAVEMAVSRLRRTLPHAGLVETIVRRGYRLVA